MKVLLIVPDYPSDKSISFQFVHNRVKEYKKELDIDVFCFNNDFANIYEYEGIKVYGGTKNVLFKLIENNNYNCYAFHFFNIRSARFILKKLKKTKNVIWFHGSDCISWKRRLGSINFNKKKLVNPLYLIKLMLFIILNKIRLIYIKKINEKCKNTSFVFVSEWNRNASELDININYKMSTIIPNYIDTNIFKYKVKSADQRLKVLSINNYANDIYAGDIIRDIIIKFSKRKEFNYFKFNLYGDGKEFDRSTNDLKQFKNINIKKGFLLDLQDIASLHNENGIFLYPKRGDSQGVSRCEAMSSGLVPIASDVEAIGEFSPEKTSYLVTSVDEFIEALLAIYNNPQQFIEKSEEAAKYISKKCSYNNTIKKEIKLLTE